MSRSSTTPRAIAIATTLALLAGVLPAPTLAAPEELFFSEYIEGSSNNKALEIYNGTGAAIDLAAGGYNVQMHFNGNPVATLTIDLTGTVGDGDVFVLAHSSASGAIRDQANQTNGSGWFNGDDAVVLRRGTSVLDVIGQIGSDPGTEWGSGVTSTADNTLRRNSGVEAGDPNGSDPFDPAVQWDGFATDTFDGLGSHSISTGGDAAPAVASTSPANGAGEVAVDATITVTFSEAVTAADGWYSISCATSGAHTATVSGGPSAYTLDPDAPFSEGETCTVMISASSVTDVDADDPPDQMAGNHEFSFTTVLPVTEIGQVQGAGHLSPLAGQRVKVEGVVIAERGSNVWVQDITPDGDVATSEAILVFGSAVSSAVVVGDHVQVRGTVAEFRPGCAPSCSATSSAFNNLTITQLANPGLGVVKLGTAALPAPTVIGAGGRIPPTQVIANDSAGDVETSNTFDPAQDGMDFFESLESMLVQVNGAVAVGPRNQFGEIVVLSDDGAGASVRTARGGILVRPGDFNPERIMLDDLFVATPVVDVADRLSTATGVMTYDFANYKIAVTSTPSASDGGLRPEATSVASPRELAVATYNVENLDPSDTTFAAHASVIVNNLRSPDIVAIEEIQDNDGAADTTVTDASATWEALIAAIVAAGGPTYDFREIDPLDDQDGGQPGGNIRVGFLFRTDRGLSFVDRPGGDAVTDTQVVVGGANEDDDDEQQPQLSVSPGRVLDTDLSDGDAFVNTRKSLVGEFRWRGETVFVIANHFSSKGDDDPLYGRFQPPVRYTEFESGDPEDGWRHAQAQVINDFVDEILAVNRGARIIVLGDINDFQFSETVDVLRGVATAGSGGPDPDGSGPTTPTRARPVLTTLVNTLPLNEQYSYVFEGNSQILDQILVSDSLMRRRPSYDIVHVNSEFATQTSDHEPAVMRVRLGGDDDD